ncbi:MAG TPA: hypothetical protein P5556_01050 [Candidatus Gastranaerophilales bacterium]|nr:hypothetical protein [Candidatus Gastranaerophilales bacterium]
MTNNEQIEMSLTKLTLYSILTLSLYTVIWFYKKWEFIRKNNIKKVNPLIRTLIMGLPILNFIMPILLFKELFAYSTNWGKYKIISISTIFSFIFCVILSFGYDYEPNNPYIYISILNFLPILIVQYYINSSIREKLKNAR